MTKIRISAFINAAQTWEQCISDAQKNPDVKNPEKLCGWLKSHGPNAPKAEKKAHLKRATTRK